MTPRRKQIMLGIGLAFAVSVFGCAQSEARPYRHSQSGAHRFVPRHHHAHRHHGRRHYAHRHHRRHYIDGHGNLAQVVGGRPAGCPSAYCGCEASRFLFGRVIPELNLAANWIRKFPHAHVPAPMMAAAKPGHVFVLLRHIEGDVWLVHDGNSGGHKTREHARSIRGYVVVNPHASQSASL